MSTSWPLCSAKKGCAQFKFVQDVEGFCALVRACPSKNVGIVFDSWNWFLGGGDVSALEQLGAERVLAVRLADCREGANAAAATDDDCLLPSSTGVIDSAAYLAVLAGAELNLPVTALGKPLDGAPTRDALVGLAQDALDKTFEAAGLPSQTRRPDMYIEASYASSFAASPPSA